MALRNDNFEDFWELTNNLFKNNPKKIEVIQLMLELGFSLKNDLKIYCGKVEIPFRNMAEALGIDRRSAIGVVKKIYPDDNDKKELMKKDLIKIQNILANIRPAGIFLQGKKNNIIEITAKSKESGIIADVTKLIAEENISIRQIFATDPDLDPKPKLIIITNREIPGDIISKILDVRGVQSAKLMKG